MSLKFLPDLPIKQDMWTPFIKGTAKAISWIALAAAVGFIAALVKPLAVG